MSRSIENLKQDEEQEKIIISANDYKKFFNNGKLSFKSAEEVQGFLYKYNKEYFLEFYTENNNRYRVESIFNKKQVDVYINKNGNTTAYGINLVSDMLQKTNKQKFINSLSQIDIEFLLTELDIAYRKELLVCLGSNNSSSHKFKR